MSMCRVITCVAGKGCLLWPVCSLDRTLLAFALLHFVLQGQTCLLLHISWFPLLAFQSPMMKRTSFFDVSSRRSWGLHTTSQLQLLLHQWLGHRLGLLWCWMVCLGREPRSFCHFWDCTKYYVLHSFVNYEGYSIPSKGFLPTAVDIVVIWLNSPVPTYFGSLIPKMLMFTLAISCLTTSGLPWFVYLTFQVPMQYCSVQHHTLLSPNTPIAEHCFCFGPATSFFLEL